MREFYAQQPGGLLSAKKKPGCGIFFKGEKVNIFARISTLVMLSLFALYTQGQNNVTGISVSSAQTGTITYGTAATASYTVILTADGMSPNGSSTLSLNWIGSTPAGITVTPASSFIIPAGSTNTTVSLTITTAATTKAGAYNFTVSCTNNPFTSASASFIVNQHPLTIVASDQSKLYGATLVLGTAAFTPTGLVNGETIGSVTLTSTGAPAAATVAGSPYTIIPGAATGGTFNAANYTITYTNGNLTVTKAPTSVLVTSDNNPACFGSPLTFTATITSILSNTTGTIQFFDNATSLGTPTVSGNTATLATSALTVGSHSTIKAIYSGDANYITSTSPFFTQTISAVPTASAGADITSCGGTSAILLTGATAGGTYSTVAWSGGGGLGSFSGAGTNPASYSFIPSVSAGTFIATLTVTGSGGCTATPSATRRIFWAAAADTWLGVNSTNWSDPANWCGGVPIYSTDVIIPAVGTVPFQPILNVTANCRNITIYGSLSSGAFDFNVYGNWTNNGSFTPGTGRTFISGFSPQFIGGSAANSFTAITLNNSGGVTITGNVSITSNLTFTYGKITTGTNTLILGAGATVTGGTTGKYVFGNLQKVINGNAATTFEVGDASVYAPAILTFSGGTNTSGTLTVSSTQGDHPNIATSFINPAKSVNRFWTISNSGVTGFSNYAALFAFVAGDIDAGATTANFTIENYSSSTWAIPTTGTKSTTTTQATNIINFGNFQIGEEITPSSCGATGNTLLPGGDITPCIDASTNKETAAAASMAANQYFTMNVIQGMVYQVYTNNPTSPANALTMSVYNDASPYAPVAFSFINTGNPKTAAVNNVYVSFTASFSGKVRVLINQKFLCGATSPAGIVVFVKVVTGSNTLDNESNAGTNSWIGHIYDNTNSGVSYNASFVGYLGYYTEPETIDELFGGPTNCFNVFSNGVQRANIYSETFSVRYRMNSTRHGLFIVDIASDDGSRLAVDNNLVYTNWAPQSGANQPTNLMSLTGNSSLVFDYYEGNAGNQVHFNNIQLVLANVLSSNLNQTLCTGSTGLTVNGDAYGTLPAGLSLSGTGYQWTYSTTPTGTRTNIAGATGASFLPATLSPFDIAGTYYIFRNAVLTSTKNIGESPYTATSESSNYLTLTITANPIILQPVAGPSTVCVNIGTTFTNSTAGGTWSIINGTGSATITTAGVLTGLTPGGIEIDYTYTSGSCFKIVKKTITIFQVPVAYNVTGNGTYCASATGLFITVSNSETGVNYQVYNGATPVGSAVPGTTGISKTFPIPTASASYTILGTNSTTGCSTTMNGTAAITINPLPTGNLSVNNLTSCAGDTLTFTALPAGYNSYVFKSGTTIIASGPSNIFKSASLTNGAVISTMLTDVNGCTATIGPLTITINNRPAGNFTASEASGITNDNIICAGSDVNFNFDNPQPSYTNYQFIINNTTTIYNGPNAYYTTTTLTDKDSVTLIVTSSNGCTTKFGPIKFTVNPLPAAAVAITGLSTVCQGQNTVVYTVPSITNATGYNWTVPTGASIVSGATTNSITVTYSTSAVSGNVTVSGNNACGDGTSSAIAVTVNPLPAPAGTITGTATVCQGQNAVTYTVPAINFATTYNWTLPAGATIVAGANTNSITVNYSAGAASGNIIVNGINACGNGVVSASFPVNINVLPGAAGTITGTAAVCVGSNNISYSIAAISNATSYTWNYSGSGATISGATNSITINFSPTATPGILSVKGVNACGNGIVSANYNITINPLPTGTLAATENSGIHPNDNIICANSAINFIATVANGANYDFKINGISTQNSTSNLFTTTALTANSSVTVDVTNTNGCVATLNPINVTVNPLPVVTLTGPNPICVGSTGNIYTTQLGQANYVWTITGGIITAGGTNTDNTITVSWTAAGTKTINVNYTNGNGCSSATSAAFTNAPSFVPSLNGPAAVCLNSTGNLYTTDAGFSNYTWTIVGGTITSGGTATDNTATVTWTSAGVKSIQINYTNSFGCNAGSPTNLPVTVNTLPSGVVSGNTSVCQGGAAPNITFTGSTGTRPYTFTYNINGAGSYTATTISASNIITVPAITTTPGIYNYNLISITDANNCGQTAGGTATVTVTAAPAGNISYPGGPFCTTASPVSVAVTGTGGGNYTALPAGLAINAANGTITPSGSAAGTYTIIYTIAPSGGCGVFTTTTSVTITTLPTVSLSYAGAPYCKSDMAGETVSISGTGAYSGGSYTASPVGLDINASTGVITPNTSTARIYTIIYTTPSFGGCGAITASTSVTVTGVPTATIAYPGSPYCSSLISAPVTLAGTGSYTIGTYTSAPGLTIDANSGSVNPSTSTPGSYLVTYTIPASGGCVAVPATTSVIITAAPTVNAGTAVATCSAGGATNITLNATATNYTLVTWTSSGTGTFSNANSLTAATYTPGASDIAAGSVILTLSAAGNGNCTTVTSTKILTINANPAAVVIKPDNPIFCLGTISPLSSVKDLVNNFSPAFNSTTNNVAIPDNNFTGIANSISVSGIPANAIINSISVNFNITHPANPDLTVNLRAPNNNELNLANSLYGANFTNTIISSSASNPIQTFGTAPYTGTFAPNAVVGALGSAFSSSFTGLYTTATSLNGSWILKVSDNGLGDIGTFNNWSITINYSLPVVAVPVTWAPFTDLYTDAGATIPYSGQTLATVYSKPSSQGIKTYTATSGSAAGCTTSTNVTVTVKPSPVVFITADYCSTPGSVTLTANSPGAVSYNWNTGANTQTILADVAHDYYASVTNSDGCVGTNVISIAQELVVNGDFTNGNTGFTSGYTYYPDVAGNNELLNDTGTNGYAVGTSGQNYHPNFYGRDHTNNQTGNRNFMLVNGHGTITTWQETVSVKPNTNYYYSAWGMNLNPASPAKLQFEVNGVAIGTIADLSIAAKPISDAQVDLTNWVRFYYGSTNGWNSGSNTTAVIRIVDLNAAASGNDFGLDDISFATLSPFVTGPVVPGTDNQVVCSEKAIDSIGYKVGSGAAGPLVTNLPPGVIYTFDGLNLIISGIPTTPGTYNYTISTTGSCPNPSAASGTIVVKPSAVITLTSAPATQAQSLCIGSTPDPVTYSITGGGTGATVTGLPPGVFGSYSGGVFTISGIPTQAGIFTYTVTTTGTCVQKTASGTFNISAATVGGSINSPAICIGNSTTLTLAGYVGNIIRWEVSTDGGTTWVPIVNTTNTYTVTTTQPSAFRALIRNNTCADAYSTGGKILLNNYWEGKINNQWSVAANWSSGNLPNMASCSNTIIIPKGINFDPILTGTGSAINLNILSNGHLTISGGNLKVAGLITNNGILDATSGGVEYNGTAPQAITPGTFLSNAIRDLTISNTDATGVTLGGPLDVYRSLTYGASGKNLNTLGLLTLKSTATETAGLGNMTGHTISGDVTVERYIATGLGAAPNHGKSWQLLAIPTTGETIKQAWQEGASQSNITSPAIGSPGNPNTGYGTMITSDLTNAVALGFDGYTQPGPSIKVFNSITSGYNGPASTAIPIYNQKGYFVFVRGDRGVTLFTQPATPTILRTKGTLFTPANPPAAMVIPASSFESVGNPYASALDMRNISRSPEVSAVFQVWDPRLGGGYNYGAFQTFTLGAGGNYYVTPGLGSYGAFNSVQNFIQSGQAFIVQTVTGGTVAGSVSFTESAKANGSALFSRPANVANVQQMLRTDLYNGAGTELIDGVLDQFDDTYNNAVDGLDARKSRNTGENLAIKTAGTLLVVERRHSLTGQDTIFLNLTGEKAQPYQFQFTADNIDATGLEGFLEDSYLHTRTPVSLSGSTVVNFTIENIAGSYAADRFRIVFAPSAVLPVTFTSVKAYQQDKNINVEWRVENENNMKQYEVEKSINGIQFTTLGIKAATANGGRSAIYVTTDVTPLVGYNYYRVKSVDMNGKTAYTNIVKVLMGSSKQDIVIVPNPITDGMIHLQLLNQPEGRYGLRLLNKIGQLIISKQVNHAEGSSTELIKWDFNLAHGMYNLEVTKPDGQVKNINVLY